MIRINPCKMPVGYDREMVYNKIQKLLRCGAEEILSFEIVKESLDARRKPELFYVLTVDVKVRNEQKLLKANKRKEVSRCEERRFRFGYTCERQPQEPVVVVGAGPAGLICAYYLAKNGFPVLLLERGRTAEQRIRDVEDFWAGGVLLPQSNVQFGEGGAGTFSDGKLNTLIKDRDGRCREILSLFVKMGAPEDIMYKQKPHVGTDLLVGMVTNLRKAIESFGGRVRFESRVTDFLIQDGQIRGVVAEGGEEIAARHVVLCIGHSARDTFDALHKKQVPMQAKAFAVGLRVMHAQRMIDESQYGAQPEEVYEQLGSAAYKLTAKTEGGRGVYTFCMCPGGYVVNASSEEGRLCVNGMSYRKRDSGAANSAVIVSVTPADFAGDGPLAGVAFQRTLEERAYSLGGGKIPIQTYGGFCRGERDGEDAWRSPSGEDGLLPKCKGAWQRANLRNLLPEELNGALMEGMTAFGRKIHGFDGENVILAGVEARTSSPVRICRGEDGQSPIMGLFPCGEGAGYAGGITSAAMDGLYIAQQVARSLCETLKNAEKGE